MHAGTMLGGGRVMLEAAMLWVAFVVFGMSGARFGMWVEDRRWREKGDHDYMNRMESGGRLYHVKLEGG